MPLVLSIDHHNGVPAYRQIVDQIKFQVASGVLPAGTEIDSTRALSARLSLNPMTISKAYSLLEHEGVLERRRGQTLVVRERARQEENTARLEALRKQLAAAAAMAWQLQVPPRDALKLFKENLDQFHP